MEVEIAKKRKRSYRNLEKGDVFTVDGWVHYAMFCSTELYVILTGKCSGETVRVVASDFNVDIVDAKLIVK